MFWQREQLRSAISMTFNQTYELELPKTGVLGSLVLYARSTDTGAGFLTARKWRLIDYISKIEVIADGSTIIKSYDGRQALYSALYDDGVLATSMWRHYSNSPHRQYIPIHFGRKLMDEIYALDLSRFNQVTLKITNDATATQFTTDIQLDVLAYWIREANIAPQGYLREEEWHTWAPVADAWEYNDLPISLPIRRILLRARPAIDTADAKNNSSMHRLMRDIEFNFRTGQTRVYRGSLENLGHLSILEMGKWQDFRGAIDRTQGYGFETDVGYVIQNLGAWGTDADGIATVLGNMRGDVQDSAQEMGYRTANGMLAWDIRGHGYGHNVPLYTAIKPDMSDILNPADMNVVQLNIQCQSGTTVTGTDRNAENAIVLSRLVR